MKSKTILLMAIMLIATGCERSTTPQQAKDVVPNTLTPSRRAAGDRSCSKLSAEKNAIPLQEDPSVPLGDQIQKARYTSVDPDITEQNFKLRAIGRHDVVLYDLKGNLSSEQVIRCIEDDGYVPATIDDAVALGSQGSQQQTDQVIVFLGTSWPSSGRLFVPALGYYTGGARALLLLSFGVSWDTTCRFAAVRQVISR